MANHKLRRAVWAGAGATLGVAAACQGNTAGPPILLNSVYDAGAGVDGSSPYSGGRDAAADGGSSDGGAPAPIDASAFASLCALDPTAVYATGFLGTSVNWEISGIAPVTDLSAWCSFYMSSGIALQIRPSDKTLLFSPGSVGIVRFSPPTEPFTVQSGSWLLNRGGDPRSVSSLCTSPSDYPYDFRVDVSGGIIAQCHSGGSSPDWIGADGGLDYTDITIYAMGPSDMKLVTWASSPTSQFQPAVIDGAGTWSKASTETTFPGDLALARWGGSSFLAVYAVTASPGDYELWNVATDGTPTRVGPYAARPTALSQNQLYNVQHKLDGAGALYELYPIFDADAAVVTPDEIIVQKRPLAPASTQILIQKTDYQEDPKASPPVLRPYPQSLVTGP
jgi:hypothetical protein